MVLLDYPLIETKRLPDYINMIICIAKITKYHFRDTKSNYPTDSNSIINLKI